MIDEVHEIDIIAVMILGAGIHPQIGTDTPRATIPAHDEAALRAIIIEVVGIVTGIVTGITGITIHQRTMIEDMADVRHRAHARGLDRVSIDAMTAGTEGRAIVTTS